MSKNKSGPEIKERQEFFEVERTKTTRTTLAEVKTEDTTYIQIQHWYWNRSAHAWIPRPGIWIPVEHAEVIFKAGLDFINQRKETRNHDDQ